MCHQHRALLEPIGEDKYSDLSPLTREMPLRHLYGESIAAFGLSWWRKGFFAMPIYILVAWE